jgi:DNA-binding PadR family transcriptional regulator
VLQRIRQSSGGAFSLRQEVLSPALYHVEHQRVITSEWGMSDNDPRAKFYRLTAAGR